MKASTQRMTEVGRIAFLPCIGIHILAYHERLAERGQLGEHPVLQPDSE